MKGKHIAFCLDQAYGNITPTLGLSLELMKRGHRVSYAVPQSFAAAIHKIHASAVIIEPLDIRGKLISETLIENDCFNYKKTPHEMRRLFDEVSRPRTAHLLSQLKQLYGYDRPDAIIHDDSLDSAGRELAREWNIAKIRHHSQFLDELLAENVLETFAEDQLVLMTVPEFFQRNRTQLDRRFRFVGFIPEGRKEIFEPWRPRKAGSSPILVSATTGMLPQISFYKTMIEAFRERPWDVILSLSGSLDLISAIDPERLMSISQNIELNRCASNFEIVGRSSLYIGQGGQGGTLEAIFCGVPQIVVPPQPYHYSVGRRVSELGLGHCFPMSELTPDRVIASVVTLLADEETQERVRNAAALMRNQRGAELAGDTIEAYLSGRTW